MKTTTKYILTVVILVVLSSCGGRKTDNNKTVNKETPKALQDEKSVVSSYKRSANDLLDELYTDLAGKTPALKKLEADINLFRVKPNEIENDFNVFDNKSDNYYNSASYKAKEISDSALRKKIETIITNSKNKYSYKISELNSLIKQINKDKATLNDHHTILKILTTLPIIEKYQTENLPDKKEFRSIFMEQYKLIQRTDSLTPKY